MLNRIDETVDVGAKSYRRAARYMTILVTTLPVSYAIEHCLRWHKVTVSKPNRETCLLSEVTAIRVS